MGDGKIAHLREKCGEIYRLLENVICKSVCTVSSIEKVDLLFDFNDNIKPLLY